MNEQTGAGPGPTRTARGPVPRARPRPPQPSVPVQQSPPPPAFSSALAPRHPPPGSYAWPAPLSTRPIPPPTTSVPPSRTTATGGPSRAEHFRPDIEGLRGLAILLVVLFHAAPGLAAGGYIGVDVFFVISGFLITGLLMRELDSRGRVDVRRFYVRRIRRLLPAASLAIGVTFLLSAMVIPPLDLPRVAGDGIASALSVANIRFAVAAGDYFSAEAAASPFLHYWSLSVEEQFYLVWPALLIVALALFRGPRGVALAVAAVAVISFGLAVVLTDVAVNWAFFSLPTRAWQLALGGLLAIAALRGLRAGRFLGVLVVVGWLGLVAVLVAGVAFDAQLAYPGLWALAPTVGAVAIILAGDHRFGPGLVLRTAPMRFFGRISYSLYLWHWPLLVLPAIAVGSELPLEVRAGLVLLAVLIATASTLIVEEPIRRSPAPASGRRQLAVPSMLVLALAVVVASGVGATTWVTDTAIAESRQPPVARADPNETTGGAEPGSRARGAAAETPRPAAPQNEERDPEPNARTKAARKTPRSVPDPPPARRSSKKPRSTPRPTPRPLPVIGLPADVRPSVWDASEDEEQLRRNYCLESEEATRPKRCVFGNTRSKFVVALVGDSHASHWFPAIQRVAKKRDWRVVTFVKVSCPFADMPVKNLRLKRTYTECARFNENTVAALMKLKPDLVITALFRFQYPVRSSDESATEQGLSVARMLDQVPGKKVILADVPFASHDVPACLSKNLKDVRRCAVASFRRSSGGSPERERIAAKRSGGSIINLGRAICGGPGDCPVVRDGMIIYRDTHHLTATFARSLAPALDRALNRVLGRRP